MKKMMFNDKYGLTKAVLEGRKTMTRRIMIPQPSWVSGDGHIYNDSEPLRFKVGEVVAVAQKYEDIYHGLSDREASWFLDTLHLRYDDKCALDLPAWRNKEFVLADLMPHQIRITDVRVERLQDISDEDCLREGIRKMTFDTFSFDSWKFFVHNPREAFAALINKISGKGTWKRNPWVFVYEFELLK